MRQKIALVTGGSRGLGKDMALSLATQGCDVIITYHTKKAEAENVVAEITKLGRIAKAVQLDVADAANVDSFFVQIKALLAHDFATSKLDYLINNAGTGN
jgi:NAD(P)-dependent dehydrogenase (short-subunit alcohol dehydrogenase family)